MSPRAWCQGLAATLARAAGAAGLAAIALSAPAAEDGYLSADRRAADFAAFCDFVAQSYAYFDAKATDWPRTCAALAPQATAATRRPDYVAVLELALAQLYDAHAHLGTHTPDSHRLVPSQTDLVARWQDGRAHVVAVRAGSGAAQAGLQPGMEVLSINGEPLAAAAAALQPRYLKHDDDAARDWALQLALAGRHAQGSTRLRVRVDGALHDLTFVPGVARPDAPLTARAVGAVGHVRLHDALGRQALVQAFDRALAELQHTQALVIDLRDTPSGGNSNVARGILGRLVDRPLPYQRHELVSEFRATGIRRVWDEYVAPRGEPVSKPVVVLVGRWTGSMGEGLAIGLHATRGAAVLGQPMARLLGAIGQTVLPHSGIAVRLPTERLFHVDGTPREAVRPCAAGTAGPVTDPSDPELDAAVALALALASGPGRAAAADLRPAGCLRPGGPAATR